jgi:hypothetical protein
MFFPKNWSLEFVSAFAFILQRVACGLDRRVPSPGVLDIESALIPWIIQHSLRIASAYDFIDHSLNNAFL